MLLNKIVNDQNWNDNFVDIERASCHLFLYKVGKKKHQVISTAVCKTINANFMMLYSIRQKTVS